MALYKTLFYFLTSLAPLQDTGRLDAYAIPLENTKNRKIYAQKDLCGLNLTDKKEFSGGVGLKFDAEKLFYSFVGENHLDIQLSYSMPPGYEDAFGTFDITVKTLFLNRALLKNRPEFEVLFYFYHELRHAMQYIFPDRFSQSVQDSISYVILFNGQCFKLVEGEWKNCQLPGEEEYFTLVYENLPYELDANLYACDTVKALLPSVNRMSNRCAVRGFPGKPFQRRNWLPSFVRSTPHYN